MRKNIHRSWQPEDYWGSWREEDCSGMRSKLEREARDSLGRSLAEMEEHCRVAAREKVRVRGEVSSSLGPGETVTS